MEFTEVKAGQKKEVPAKMVIYAEPKVGKTTFAAESPDPFFINIEGGLDYLAKEVRSTPKLNAYDEVVGWMNHIYSNKDFTAGTIVIDSLDWLEELAQAKLIKQYGAESITDPKIKDFAYFKGASMAADLSIRVLRWLDAIYHEKGIKSILIAHSQVKTVDLPNQEPYMRHELKMTKQLAAKVNEWADLILFAGYAFHVTKDGKTTDPRRVLFGGDSMAFVGGGRMILPKEIELNYESLRKEIEK